MIVLDTNVVSELMRGSRADPRVLAWARALTQRPLTTVVTRAEILLGVASLPPGRRRDDLAAAAGKALARFETVLPFTEAAADHYADICAVRRRQGRPIPILDAQIAAMARSIGASVATRNVTDFADIGVRVVNPWLAA